MRCSPLQFTLLSTAFSSFDRPRCLSKLTQTTHKMSPLPCLLSHFSPYFRSVGQLFHSVPVKAGSPRPRTVFCFSSVVVGRLALTYRLPIKICLQDLCDCVR
uniref:Uncharacterized protein n=1 Tax=Trypanosoma vivax (strain Y486) TaxID=1055687 RepID=G0U3W3_TRYVY|nr:hypothetical protein TVY486_0900260 [Trypanosoma vivax Y486]